jgi:hypothetical protein
MILGGGCVRSWCGSSSSNLKHEIPNECSIHRRYNTPLFYDAVTQKLAMGEAAVPGMLVRHSAHLLVQQQQQQQSTSQCADARIVIMMGGAFCFSFGCVFSPCYLMPLPVPAKSLAAPQAQPRTTVEVDVLLCPKVRSLNHRGAVQVYHASRVARHTSHVTRHTSHVTRHTSHVTRHTSHVTRHTPHATRHTSPTK